MLTVWVAIKEQIASPMLDSCEVGIVDLTKKDEKYFALSKKVSIGLAEGERNWGLLAGFINPLEGKIFRRIRINHSDSCDLVIFIIFKRGLFPVDYAINREFAVKVSSWRFPVINEVQFARQWLTGLHWVVSHVELYPWALVNLKSLSHNVQLTVVNESNCNSGYDGNSFKHKLEMLGEKLRDNFEPFRDRHRCLLLFPCWGFAFLCSGRFLICAGRYGGRVRPLQSLLSLLLAFVFISQAISLMVE